MINILFVGNYLSKSKGTFGVSEHIAQVLPDCQFHVRLTSRKQNRFLRLIDIVLNCSFSAYSIIQIDTFSGSAFIIAEVASSIAKLRGKKIILTLHGGKLPEFFLRNKKRIKRVFQRSNRIQTPSLYLQQFFRKNGTDINYLPNPIPIRNFPYNRSHVKLHTLLWVRAFNEIYNPTLAVETLYEIKKKYADTTLTMVGPNKGTLAEVKRLIDRLGLNESVDITGPLRNEDLYELYQTHEVYLNTTSYESFGVAVVEASACGIPVVSTPVGEIPFLWQHRENILMVEKSDPKLFSCEVQELFESKELANHISVNARKKAERFSWEIIKNEWLSILR